MSSFEKKERNLNQLIDKLNSLSLSYSQPNYELEKIKTERNELSNQKKEVEKKNEELMREHKYLKEKINSIHIIEQFEIFKNYPSTLKIFIKETKILAQTKKNGSNYFIGSNGKLILNDFSGSSLPFVFGDLNVEEFLNFKNEVDKSNFDFKKIIKLYLSEDQ